MVHPHGRGRRRVHQGQGAQDAAPAGPGRHRPHPLLPRQRQGPVARHDRGPPRLVHQPSAQLGRAGAVLPAQGQRRVAPAHDGDPRPGGRHRRERWHRGLEPCDDRRHSGCGGRGPLHQEHRHPGSLVRFRVHLLACAAWQPRRRLSERRLPCARSRGRPVSRRPRPAPWLVPQLAAAGLRPVRPRALPRPADARLRHRWPGPQDEQEPGQHGRAAECDDEARCRDRAPVGGQHRLLGRPEHRRQDPRPRGGRLPAHPQHPALPAGQRQRLRPGAGHRARRPVAGDRRLRPGAGRPAAGRDPAALRRLRIPSGRQQAAGVLLRRPRCVLP
ncbi:MAG: hypothetical protein BWX79_02851 [Alphaproteobacteria bacterium ADurb.Bin100]|nr:MAG: hypothetical protein BWX79_02851 [Alphaproteobacteria bacterium ADurb.Bin100]